MLFRSIQTGLQPIYSEKKVHSHSPNGLTPVTLEACYTEYNYSVVVDYNNNGAAGTAVLTDLTKDDSSVTTNFEISQKYSYIDNEELLFAIRGMTLTAAQQVNVYNASSRAVQPSKLRPRRKRRTRSISRSTASASPARSLIIPQKSLWRSPTPAPR